MGAIMPIIKKNGVEIYYEEAGTGFPLLVLPGGGLNATVAGLKNHAFNPISEFSNKYRVIALDLRNANDGKTIGPLEIEKTWDSFTEDQLTLMDYLGIEKFMVLGFCIGGPLIWNLLRKAKHRVTCATLVHPSGFTSSHPDIYFQNNITGWMPNLIQNNPKITLDMATKFLDNMYTKRADFVFTVDRDFVRNCETPILILPDDIPAHPYATAMETALLAPNSQVSLYPWKENDRKIELALRHISIFLSSYSQPDSI